MMKRGFLSIALAASLLAVGPGRADDSLPSTVRLALNLQDEGDHLLAAVEFRRMIDESTTGADKSAAALAAAHEYIKAKRLDTATQMLDLAEDLNAEHEYEALLLRGHIAEIKKRHREAKFYYESVLNGTTNSMLKSIAGRSLAALHLSVVQDVGQARLALVESGTADDAALDAIELYSCGKDKKPVMGGILGIIPGLGYAYSGEYANCLRSLILNGLFIWGMIDTAENEEWGFFGVITFFELTWYSGSIYGGIDAAHRHNRDRLNECLVPLRTDTELELDRAELPLLSFRITF